MDSGTPLVSPAQGALSALSNNVNFVGSAWVVSSAICTTYSTTKFLKHRDTNHGVSVRRKKDSSPTDKPLYAFIPRPALLTLYRFGGSLLLGLLAHNNLNIVRRFQDTVRAAKDFIVPAAFLFLANFSNSISLDRVGISLTYTTKCGIPLVTVLLTLLMDGPKALPRLPVLLSLIPIAAGIACASWDHPHFNLAGFLAGLVSLTAQSALNVTSKRVMTRTGINGPNAQRAMVAVGFVITAVLTALQVLLAKKHDSSIEPNNIVEKHPPSWLTSMAVVAYHVEYVLSFMFVKLVAPITYGACDAIRRLSIIVSGHYMFGGHPFSLLNITGIIMALLGALAYSIASHS